MLFRSTDIVRAMELHLGRLPLDDHPVVAGENPSLDSIRSCWRLSRLEKTSVSSVVHRQMIEIGADIKKLKI